MLYNVHKLFNFYLVVKNRIHLFLPILSRLECLILPITISWDEIEHFPIKIASHLCGTFLCFINCFNWGHIIIQMIYSWLFRMFIFFILFKMRWWSQFLNVSVVILPNKHSPVHDGPDLTSHKLMADTWIAFLLEAFYPLLLSTEL